MNEMTRISLSDGQQIYQDMLALVPEIAARSEEIDRTATVPKDLLDRIERAGGFRMALPAEFGGAEMSLREACTVVEAVSGADGAVGWQMSTALGTHIATARLPYATMAQFYAAGPDTWSKGAYTPKSVAVPVEGGYLLSGRWPFASGAREFEWVSLGFMIKEGNGIRMMPDGIRPDIRICLLPRYQVTVLDTWHVTGMRGTRSDDLELRDVFIPEDKQGPFFGPANFDAPIVRGIMPSATAPVHSAIMLGILKAAMADLAHVALTRKPASNPKTVMKDDPVFLHAFGQLSARVNALDALYQLSLDLCETISDARRLPTPLEETRLCADGTYINHESTRIMDEIMMHAGSSAIYEHQAQQRRWRDLRVAAQHQVANLGHYGRYGGELVRASATA